MSPGQKALALSYIHSELLITNLDVSIHELKVLNDPAHKRLQDKLVKLQSASRNALRGIKKSLEEDNTLEELKEEIEILIETAWQ